MNQPPARVRGMMSQMAGEIHAGHMRPAGLEMSRAKLRTDEGILYAPAAMTGR